MCHDVCDVAEYNSNYKDFDYLLNISLPIILCIYLYIYLFIFLLNYFER